MDTSSGTYACAVAGKRGLKFISYSNGVLDVKKGIFGGNEMEDMSSVCFFADGNTCASGSVKGGVYIWGGN
jgi:hypothetical protein